MPVIQENLKEVEQKMMGKYLTENFLGDVLRALYPEKFWEQDKRFKLPGSTTSLRYRPDYCCHELKMCVEFDGPDHYTKANIILTDTQKDDTLKSYGYSIIRIPYFVQLNTFTIKYFFNVDVEFNYGFKHGFVSRNVVLPASFCEQGIWKFDKFITSIQETEIYTDIKESLIGKIRNFKLPYETAMLSVLPSSMLSTFDLLKYDHDSVDNQYKIKSTLETGWNCVILESSQTIRSIPGVYDMRYGYNSEGNVNSVSFQILYNYIVYKYVLKVEHCKDDNSVILTVHVNDELRDRQKLESSEINLFNIIDILP